MSDKNIVIISPHADDEIIGCFEIINSQEFSPVILYMCNIDKKSREEAIRLKKFTNINIQMFVKSVPPIFLNKNTTLYFPDPSTEIHPEHRMIGSIGEQYLRNGLDIIFYSIQMNTPYIHEVHNSENKEDLLNKIYYRKKSLWEYEKKYILFEGRVKWLT